LNQNSFEESLPKILNAMDLPSCDGINTWFISKFAAENGLKAVLSGLGGDELYGGYPSFSRFNKAKWLQRLPDFMKTISKNSSSKKLSRLSYLKLDGIKGIYLFLRGHFTPVDIANYLGAYETEIWSTLNSMPAIIDTEGIDDKDMAGWMEFNLYMQNQLLRDSDVMSMKHGVEIRVPFLDDKNVRLANKISSDIKYPGELPKQFLINTFINDIPQEIWNRPKMGFSFPFAQWLTDSNYVKEIMQEVNPKSRDNYNKFMSGKLHWSQLMLMMLMNLRSNK
jgi:asparagine synthase (glutamine-hydrolysing)